jgi:hypothetical protein
LQHSVGHFAPAFALGLCLVLAAPLAAQDRAVIQDTADPPRGPRAAEVQDNLRRDGVATDMTYALRVTGDLADGRTEVQQPERREQRDIWVPTPGSASTLVVVLLLLALLLLWLRFGGAGMLLSRAPQPQAKRPATAPDAWNITAEDRAHDPMRLLEQIAAMPDRAAALVRLSRHCLLTAATETDTRLARADTERTAFRRLPGGWRAQDALRDILGRAELAHYGGRPVNEAEFAATLDLGRAILLRQGARVGGTAMGTSNG